MSIALNNDALRVYDGKLAIDYTANPSSRLHIGAPSVAKPALKIDRVSGYESFQAIYDWLILESGSGVVGFNHYTNKNMYICYNGGSSGGGDVAMGTSEVSLTTGCDLNISGTIYNGAWTEISTFYNGWGNYGSPFCNLGVLRDKNGVVHIRGIVRYGTYSGSIICYLPPGFWPDTTKLLVVLTYTDTVGRVDIRSTDGAIIAQYGYGTPPNTWLNLHGISFKAAGY